MIGELLVLCYNKPHHHPTFFNSSQRIFLSSSNTPINRYIISVWLTFLINIMAQTSYVQSVSFGDGNANSGNTINSFNNTFNMSDEDGQIMCWLSPLEPNKRHQDVRTDRLSGVGDWILEMREFREWRGSECRADKAILFCSGNPGVGKTYLR